jgi:methyl-accepting chemotaxis protein
LVAVIPGGVILVSDSINRWNDVESTKLELHGIKEFHLVSSLFTGATQHRRYARQLIINSGNDVAAEKLKNSTAAIEKSLSDLIRLNPAGPSHQMLSNISARWQRIDREWRNWRAPENDYEHGELVDTIENLRYFIAGSSTLLLDPAANAYFQIDLSVNQLPALRRNIVDVRELFDGSSESKNPSATWEQWVLLDARLERNVKAILTTISLLQVDSLEDAKDISSWFTPTTQCLRQSRERFRSINGNVITRATIDQTANDVTQCLIAIDQFVAQLMNNVESKVLPARLSHYETLFWLNLIVGMTLLLVGSTIVWAFGRDLTHRSEHLKSMIVSMQEGDFSEIFPLPARDEIGEAASLAHKMRARWTDVVMGLRGQATLMLKSSSGMESKATELSGNSLRQRDDAVEIANQVKELSVGIESIAGDTENVLYFVRHTSEIATRSAATIENVTTKIRNVATSVDNSEQLIAALDERVSTIGHIVVAIREISDKTNLLALNAAIEAARAGEAGRGFAVVADEVRTLANMTAESTSRVALVIKEIQDNSNNIVEMITTCADQAKTAVVAATTATEDMLLINQAAANSAQKVESISLAIIGQRKNADIASCRVKDVAEMSTSSAAMTTEVSDNSKLVDQISKAIYKEASYFRIATSDSITMF